MTLISSAHSTESALATFSEVMLPAIEEALQRGVARASDRGGMETLHHMLAYHMGWEDDATGQATGKRVRPLLVTLTTAAGGGDWKASLPAAACVELIHNFSLIHDDIEDNSPYRRGRPAVWKRWGVPQAINTGDTLFTLGHLAILNLEEHHPPATVLEAVRLVQSTCLHLTQGQFLDLSYEGQEWLSVEAYWPMVSGKTAALLSACTELGALLAHQEDANRVRYRQFGRALGLAFQAQDDLLGIWGETDQTGKSATSDLVEGKKSLPVLFGLSQEGPFARRWAQGPIRADEVRSLARQLESEGAKDYTKERVDEFTAEALLALEEAAPQGNAAVALEELALRLLHRRT